MRILAVIVVVIIVAKSPLAVAKALIF